MLRRAAGLIPVLACLVASGVSAARAESVVPEAGERWIEVRTAHFTLFSNASENRTREIGGHLELFRAALARLVAGLEVNSPLPTWVYVFKSDASFAPYKKRVGLGPANVSGAFAAHRDGNYVALDASFSNDPWGVVYHEYLHYFLNNNFEEIPLWFNEGMAECYSSFAGGSGHVEVGLPNEAHLDLLRNQRWIPFPDLFTVGADSKAYNETLHQGMFYAESWALVHYLAWGRTGETARGFEFLSQFPPRAKLREALRPLLGPSWSDLEEKVKAYVRKGRHPYSVVDLKTLPIEPPSPTLEMTRAQVLSRLGDYLVHTQTDRAADAEALFQAALQEDSTLAPAYCGLGYLRDLQKRTDEATAAYERALKLAPDDPLTQFLFAESLMNRILPPGAISLHTEGPAVPPELARARALYRASIKSRPRVAEAYAGLGSTFTIEDTVLAEGIAALETARRMLPARMDVVINLAGLYARSGERAKAQDLVENVLGRSDNRPAKEIGREILLQADLGRAAALVNSGDLEGGVAILKDVQAKTRDVAVRKQVAEQIASVEGTRVANRQIETYNRAVDLANHKDYRKAADLLEGLANEVKDPKLLDETNALLRRLREAIAAEAKR